ncbi:ATP-binding protein [Nocardia sp. NPDC058640]|uniref:ATP-binding protein n=1 Tax=Nocardia sp. NPDC058640 TaxID=3346571 RepID=UPI00364E9DC6
MSGTGAPAPLVDRVDELAMLLAVVDRSVESREAQVVVLRGEAGVGKTSLLTIFAHEAAERHSSAHLLTGYGQAMLNSLASDSFQAVRECLRSLAASAQRSGSPSRWQRITQSFKQNAPDWIESVPVVGQVLAAGVRTGQSYAASGGDRTEMDSRLDQLLRLIEDIVTDTPLVMVLDDLHWADTATIDLLTAIALRVQGPLVLVLAYRSDQLKSADQTHPLQRTVFKLCRYRPETPVIDLLRLSPQDTEELVRRTVVGPSASPNAVSRIVRLSDGNPLFAESLARVDRHRSHQPPRQITSVIEDRLSYLTSEDQRLLETAALIGYSFEVDYLAQLTRVDIDDVYERLHVLFDEHDLVRPAEQRNEYDRYRIHHPLFAQVLRERGAANAPRWRRHHAKLLQIIEAEQDWDDELFVRAAAVAVEASNGAKAGALALQAARRQFALGAVSKARDLARIAVDNTPHFAAFALLAECLSAGGDHAAGIDACAAGLALPELAAVAPAEVAHLRLLWARNLRMTCRWEQAVEVLDQLAIDFSEPGGVLAETLNLYAEVALCGPVQDFARCVELCDQVAAMSAEPEVQSRAFGHRGLAHLAAGEPMEAEQWLQKAIDIARAAGHPYAEYEAVHWLSKKTMACMEVERSAELLTQLREMSQASGVASENPPHVRDLSRVLGMRGEFPNAANAFAVFTDISQSAAAGRVSTTLACQLSEIESLRGPFAAAEFLDEVLRAANEDFLLADSRELLRGLVERLSARPPGWDPVTFAVAELGVPPEHAQAAEAIFRFDVPSLAHLRAGLA